MKAMVLTKVLSLASANNPLDLVDLPTPEPGHYEILVKILTCGVCHTDLDEIEGRTTPPHLPVVLGHEVVGRVVARGAGVLHHHIGDRVGIGWIHSSSGAPDENVSPRFCATGRDVNGGYAEYMTVAEDYAYSIPATFSDVEAAPLLCAGAVGYRALRLTNLCDGQSLGLTGFGGSAHLVLQLAKHQFPHSRIYVFARNERARQLAVELGANWAGDTADRAPEPLDAVIDTTPAWKPVIEALANLRPGGRLVINAIRKEEGDRAELLNLSYHDHLWMEREIKTVANVTQWDIRESLVLAAQVPLRPRTEVYSLANANQALVELKRAPVRGTKVLRISE